MDYKDDDILAVLFAQSQIYHTPVQGFRAIDIYNALPKEKQNVVTLEDVQTSVQAQLARKNIEEKSVNDAEQEYYYVLTLKGVELCEESLKK